MVRSRPRRSRRRRVGRVSYYRRRGGWCVSYRDAGRQVRRRVADSEAEAATIAAQLNAQLASSLPTPFSFTPVTVSALRTSFLEHHEHVLRSSLATISRYRAALQHLENFAASSGDPQHAHQLSVEQFAAYLRGVTVAANGHPHTARRRLRGKGVRYILEVCRSLYGFAGRRRHLPPYTDNPFSGLNTKRMRIEDAKPLFVFDATTELAFFAVADAWSFPVHFTLAKTGMRSGELVHLLVEDLDLEQGWLHVRNKPAIGWRIKTGRERSIPLVPELVSVLRRVVGNRTGGTVFYREKFVAVSMPLAVATSAALASAVVHRVAAAERDSQAALSRAAQARLICTVWRDAGAVRSEAIRQSFLRTTRKLPGAESSCPKSWRHTFATLLQDANVDPLIRQLTLGHQPVGAVGGVLGMTTVYTHTRPETLKREIERALRYWPRSLELAAHWAERRTS